MKTADEVLEWARGVEPATWGECVNHGIESRRARYEASLANDQATAERIALALELLDELENGARCVCSEDTTCPICYLREDVELRRARREAEPKP